MVAATGAVLLELVDILLVVVLVVVLEEVVLVVVVVDEVVVVGTHTFITESSIDPTPHTMPAVVLDVVVDVAVILEDVVEVVVGGIGKQSLAVVSK